MVPTSSETSPFHLMEKEVECEVRGASELGCQNYCGWVKTRFSLLEYLVYCIVLLSAVVSVTAGVTDTAAVTTVV